MGDAVCGHLKLLHGFQQRRLRARRGAVDFVGQNNLGENRAGPEFEFRTLLIKDQRAGDIGRQQVGSKLNTAEFQTH